MYESPEYTHLEANINRLNHIKVWVDRARTLRSMAYATQLKMTSHGREQYSSDTHEHDFNVPDGMRKEVLENLAQSCERMAHWHLEQETKLIDIEKAAKI